MSDLPTSSVAASEQAATKQDLAELKAELSIAVFIKQ